GSGAPLQWVTGMSACPAGWVRSGRERRRAGPPPAGRRVRVSRRATPKARVGGGWTLPLPTIDPHIIVRSAAALDRYGPDFSYGHYLAVRRLATAAGMAAGAGALVGLSALPPTRNLLLR